ncbi:hypothetical protein JCM6882_008454 [Rhodosporidiobolus microsporus]
MGKKKLSAAEEKTKGNDLFKQGAYAEAVERYTRAIEKSEAGTGREQERSVYYLNRAQGWLKLDNCGQALTSSHPSPPLTYKFAEAESDCTAAISLTTGSSSSPGPSSSSSELKPSSKAYWRRASARKELAATLAAEEGAAGWRVKARGAIDDYRKWHALAMAEKSADSQSVRIMKEEVEALERKAEMAIGDVRKQKVKEALAGVVDLKTRDGQREYPELLSHTLSTGSNLLDLISARALRAPAAFAFHLDHVRAQTVLKSRQPPPPPRSLYGYAAPRASQTRVRPLSEYMQILELPDQPAYGEVVTFNAGNEQRQSDAKKKIERGEACTKEEGELMLERQRVLYLGALSAAQGLLALSEGEEDEVDEEAVEEYEARVKARDYAGREEFRLERVEETVKGFLGYAEDHLEFLRGDSEYVADYVLDRISPSAVPGSPVQRMLVREEALQLFLNAFARQTLWKEALSLLSHLRTNFPPTLGTSPSLPLPPVYARKIGLVAKLVDAFVDLAFRELTQSVEHSFEEDLRKIGNLEADDEFFTFLDVVAQFNGLAARAPSSTARREQINPVARMFKALCAIDPSRNPEKTWEVVACLNELKTLFEAHPEQKSKLSRRLVEGLGEYAEAIELREMLLDSHLPRFNKDWADKSTFLSRVQPLWISLERCWVKSVSNDMAGHFIAQKDDTALQSLWSAFDKQCLKDCRALPEQLFDDLLSDKPAERAPAPTASDDEDEGGESDGPPPLVEISESESEDEDDGPPPLVQLSDEDDLPDMDYGSEDDDDYSDDDEYRSVREEYAASLRAAIEEGQSARATPPRPRLNRHRLAAQQRQQAPRPAPREPQPGPSSGTAPAASQRRAAPAVDEAALPDLHELEIRQRERERAAEADAGQAQGQVRREKVKTRKGPSGEDKEKEWETTESSASETETEAAWPEGLILKVSKRGYDVWEQVLGGENIRRSDVAWTDFLMAMHQIGFQADKGSGSRWKFHPRGPLKHMGTIVFHEPHPASTLRVFQVHKIEARLKRRFGLHIERFELDRSRRDEVRSNL